MDEIKQSRRAIFNLMKLRLGEFTVAELMANNKN
jgi:hypothetical protein